MAYPVVPDVPVGNINQSSPYLTGATPVTATSGDVAAAVAAAQLAAASGKKTYLTGFEVIGSGATAASVVDVTVTDGTWTVTYPLAVVAGATLQNAPLVMRYSPPLVSSAVNTAITVSCPSLGTGNAHNCTNAEGYQL